MGNIKASEAGIPKAVLAVAVKQGGNNELGLQVQDYNRALLFQVIRAHNTIERDNTVIATIRVHRNQILKLAEQIKTEDEQRAAEAAYDTQRMNENKAAGLPILTGAVQTGIGPDGASFTFPPREEVNS